MFRVLAHSMGAASRVSVSGLLSHEMLVLDSAQRRAASMGGLRDQKHKTVEELRKKRQSLKDAKVKRQENGSPVVFDKAVAQAHQEIADEQLFDERKKMYGSEVAAQMLEEDRFQRDLKAWNDRRTKLRNKSRGQ